MNFPKLADELGIAYITTRQEWVQMTCPFCTDSGQHLGFNTISNYFHCFRCGWHPLVETIAELAGIAKWQAADAIERHRDGHQAYRISQKKHGNHRPKKVLLPYGIQTLTSSAPHLAYLDKRGFPLIDAHKLMDTYNLWATGPVGDYKLRIIIPINHYGRLVSYQGRDITGKSKLRYKACSKELEARSLKDCLYAADLARKEYVAVTEGVFGVWRLGPGTVATFGAEFTWAQVKQLADRWKYRFIAFDPDAAGQQAAKKLSAALSALPGKTYILHDLGTGITGPDDLNEKQVKSLWTMVKETVLKSERRKTDAI